MLVGGGPMGLLEGGFKAEVPEETWMIQIDMLARKLTQGQCFIT